MDHDNQPPYTENEQAILNCAHELIKDMRLLTSAVTSGEESVISRRIYSMRLTLRWLRTIERALTKELKTIEGKHPVRPGDVR